MLQMHIIPVVGKRLPNVSSQRQRPMEIDGGTAVIEAGDWTMAEVFEEYYQCFNEKLLRCAERTEHGQPWRMDSRIFDATKELLEMRRIMRSDNIKKWRTFFSVGLIEGS